MNAFTQRYGNRQAKSRQFFLQRAEPLLRQLESLIESHSLVGNPPFIEDHPFPGVRMLENDWYTIAQELDDLLQYQDELPTFPDLSPDQYRQHIVM